jgi:hypothetical protein
LVVAVVPYHEAIWAVLQPSMLTVALTAVAKLCRCSRLMAAYSFLRMVVRAVRAAVERARCHSSLTVSGAKKRLLVSISRSDLCVGRSTVVTVVLQVPVHAIRAHFTGPRL